MVLGSLSWPSPSSSLRSVLTLPSIKYVCTLDISCGAWILQISSGGFCSSSGPTFFPRVPSVFWVLLKDSACVRTSQALELFPC